MDVRDLGYLHAILRHGSVAAAAAQVGRTPPALTKAVRRLEEDLGVTLFHRVGRGVEPTDAALCLADRTRDMVTRLDLVRRQVVGVHNGQHGHIRLGVAATMAAIFLPSFLRRLAARHPDLRISVLNGMNDVLHRALRAGEIDLVLGVVDMSDPDVVDGRIVAEDQVRIASACHHPLQGRPVTLDQVLGERWVLPSRSVAMRQWFDAAFVAKGHRPPDPHVETSSIAILEELLAETDYLSFISDLKMTMPSLRARIAPLDIPAFTMRRDIGATWLRHPAPSPALKRVLDEIAAVP